MIVLFDTNVILDVLLDREPFVDDSSDVLSRAERGELDGLVAATTVTTIHYLCRKGLGQAKARRQLSTLLGIVEIAAVNRAVIDAALQSKVRDFEDAVLVACAELAGADAIAVRNKKDFAASTIPVYTPTELCSFLDAPRTSNGNE